MISKDQMKDDCFRALKVIFEILGINVSLLNKSFCDYLNSYSQRKSDLGGGDFIRTKLSFIKKNDFDSFEKCFKTLKESDQLNEEIRFLRFLNVLSKIPHKSLNFLTRLRRSRGTRQVHSKVMATEKTLRSLVTENYKSQDRLENRLFEIYQKNPAKIGEWKAKGDPGDILSGSNFSEIIELYCRKEEFCYYDQFYSGVTHLGSSEASRLESVRDLANDLREIRNIISHCKRLNGIHTLLCEISYDQLIGPVKDAFQKNLTTIDPSKFETQDKKILVSYARKQIAKDVPIPEIKSTSYETSPTRCLMEECPLKKEDDNSSFMNFSNFLSDASTFSNFEDFYLKLVTTYKDKNLIENLWSDTCEGLNWPETHGVFVVKHNFTGEIIYVGKAGSLRNQGQTLSSSEEVLKKKAQSVSSSILFTTHGLNANQFQYNSLQQGEVVVKSIPIIELSIDCFLADKRFAMDERDRGSLDLAFFDFERSGRDKNNEIDFLTPSFLRSLILQVYYSFYQELPIANTSL